MHETPRAMAVEMRVRINASLKAVMARGLELRSRSGGRAVFCPRTAGFLVTRTREPQTEVCIK